MQISESQQQKVHQLINDASVSSAMEFTDYVVKSFPGRMTGQPAQKEASHAIFEEYRKHCDKTSLDEFSCHPRSFFGYFGFMALFYIIGTAFIWLDLPWVAFSFYLAITLTVLTQFVFYKGYIDFLFPKVQGYNVHGIIEPPEKAQKQVIISGHHDSIWVSNYIDKVPRYYTRIVLFGFFSILLGLIFGLVNGIQSFTTSGEYSTPLWIQIVLTIGIIFVLPFMRFTRYEISPAAGDNMIASSIANEIGKIVTNEKNAGTPIVKNTRVIIASFDAEEAGIRGSRNFAQKYAKMLKDLPTKVINYDSIYDPNEINIFNRDLNGTVKLDPQLALDIQKVGNGLGIPSKVLPMPFGGGATDAAAFGEINVSAINIIAMNVAANGFSETVVYHTPRDLVENIDPNAVEACMKLGLGYLLAYDAEKRSDD